MPPGSKSRFTEYLAGRSRTKIELAKQLGDSVAEGNAALRCVDTSEARAYAPVRNFWRGSQVVRSGSAKPLFAGSIPAPASCPISSELMKVASHPRFEGLQAQLREAPQLLQPWSGAAYRVTTLDYPRPKSILLGQGSFLHGGRWNAIGS